jgi:hypothetical protein
MRDELTSPDLHQWLCLCRQLMMDWPTTGAEGAAMLLGDLAGFQPGWNRRSRGRGAKDVYFFIGGEQGFTTETAPDVPASEVNLLGPPKPLEESFAWTILKQLGRGLSTEVGLSAPVKERIINLTDHIAACSHQEHDIEVFKSGLPRFLGPARVAWASRDQTGPREVEEKALAVFLLSAQNLIDQYMRNAVPGGLAKHFLSAILTMQCSLPNLGDATAVPFERILHTAQHLANLTQKLLARRSTLNVTGYFDSSYLACLYAATGWLIAKEASERSDLTDQQRQSLERLAFNLDETNAYHLGVTFRVPAMFCIGKLAEYLNALDIFETRIAWARREKLHPCLVETINEIGNNLAQPTALLDRYSELAKSRPSLSIREAIHNEFSPVAPSVRAVIIELWFSGKDGTKPERSLNT